MTALFTVIRRSSIRHAGVMAQKKLREAVCRHAVEYYGCGGGARDSRHAMPDGLARGRDTMSGQFTQRDWDRMQERSGAIVGRPGEESSDYLLLGAVDPSWCPCDECTAVAEGTP